MAAAGSEMDLRGIGRRIAAAAAKYPGATLEHPWGENVYKVNGKVFVFLGTDADDLGLSVKLPHSADAALMLPFASPTAYGLGKAGWISAKFERGQDVPEGLLLEWLNESYRAIAPKKLLKELDGAAPAVASVAKKAATKKPAAKAVAKKAAAKKPAPRKKR